MPKCEFSETQYSFGFVQEILKLYTTNRNIFPMFPSTAKEGKKGFGFDVKINNNLFYQFKVPFFVTQKSKKTTNQWDAYNNPFYRIKINTDGKQFQQLKDLKKPNNQVFYSTPEFHTESEFQQNYFNDNLVRNSSIYPINAFPSPNSGKHSLTYQKNSVNGLLFSEPLKINKENVLTLSDNEISLREEMLRLANLLKIKLELKPNNIQENINFLRLKLYSDSKIVWLPIIK